MNVLQTALEAGALDPRQLAFHAEWRPPAPLWRVYSETYGPVGFNGTDRGYARFSPLRRSDRSIVSVLYAGTSLEVALMEAVVRDVPTPSAGYILSLPAPGAEPRRVTQLNLDRPLRMVDFGSVGLRRFGLSRTEVIDCNSAGYPDTQALGAWVHASTAMTGNPVHGIVWTSRQDDSGQAVIFFGDRLPGPVLTAIEPGQSLHTGRVLQALVRLAERMGVLLDIG